MNTHEPFATMQTQKLFLSLFATQRDLDRLDTRRREIMAEISARLAPAKNPAQPESPPPTSP
jgi:hypothetical protein